MAYLVSRFPKLTETFVLNELLALESDGVPLELYPLLREKTTVTHAEARRWSRRAHYQPFLSREILGSLWRVFRRDPRVLVATWLDVLRRTWGNARFFLGAVAIFPKVVHMAQDMERRGVDHVHAHFATHPTAAAYIVERLTGIPYSFTAHGSDLHVDRRMLDAKVERAAFAVTISQFNRRVMLDACGEANRDKIHVVHCGIDPERFRPIDGRPRARSPIRIVCVGALVEVKGHRFLVEACRLLAARRIAFQCDLVGDGPLREPLQAQIDQAGLVAWFTLHGHTPSAEVARIVARADVAVLASHPTASGRREGIPVALMEAMGCGLPVVASDLSGIPELVEHEVTGLLVKPGDARGLADALLRLCADPRMRADMGRKGRERVMQDFDLARNASRVLELIETRGAEPRLRVVGADRSDEPGKVCRP